MNYVDPGASYYETRYRERVIDNLHRHAKAFGFILQEVDKAGLPTLAYGPE
jgi:transposase